MAESKIKLLDTLLSNRIKVFSDTDGGSVNHNTTEITVPTIGYSACNGWIYSRYGIAVFGIQTDGQGVVAIKNVNTIFGSEVFTISQNGNVVKIKSTNEWDHPIVMIAIPSVDQFFINNLSVAFTKT